MRFLAGFVLGTLGLGVVTFILMSANGSPVPRDWKGMLAYPTGSGLSYFLLASLIYAVSLWLTHISARRTMHGSPRSTSVRNSVPSGTSPARASGRAGRPRGRRA